jgi:hypothetical protein
LSRLLVEILGKGNDSRIINSSRATVDIISQWTVSFHKNILFLVNIERLKRDTLKHSPFYLAIPTAPAAENRDAPQSD